MPNPKDSDTEDFEDSSFTASCRRAEEAALRLIARAEQNSMGLTNKLKGRGYDNAVVKAVISSLIEQDLLNDSRYAELWIRSRISSRKAQSPRQIQISLGNKGIGIKSSREALERTLEPEAEYALLLRFLDKNDSSRSQSNYSLRGQLKYEGFSPDAIDRYFDDLSSPP